MPVMLPEISSDNIPNEGEKAVYAALKAQLPSDWVVRYNFLFSRKRAGRICPDGQVDFIVVIPREGILFLEVKGIKNATFCTEGGRSFWKQPDGRVLETQNPFEQAQGNKHDIVKMMRDDLWSGAPFDGRYGHAVVFPFAGATGQLPVSHEPQFVVLYHQMSYLQTVCLNALRLFGEEYHAVTFTDEVMEAVCNWLRDRVELSPVSVIDADEDDRKIESLTRGQHEAYLSVLDNTRVRVEGVAGSGKTLIALWTAQALHKRGLKVLLLCYNKALSSWLQSQTVGPEVRHFHSLCKWLCGKAGVTFVDDRGTSDFWNETAPIQLMTAIERMGQEVKYDAILVDEGQDFHENWWTPIEMLLRDEKSRLHFFLDPNQAGLYGERQSYPSSSFRYDLLVNCRNTQCIAQESGRVINKSIPSKVGTPVGIAPTFLEHCGDVRKRAQQIDAMVTSLIHEGYKPCDIAILTPWSRENENCALKYLSRINGVPIQSELKFLPAWRKGHCFWGATVKAFKGLEARCVILTDIPNYCPPAFGPTDLYVAETRAKLRLYCIPSESSILPL